MYARKQWLGLVAVVITCIFTIVGFAGGYYAGYRDTKNTGPEKLGWFSILTSGFDSITAEEILGHIEYLAGPEPLGRNAGTEGNLKAGQYLAGQLSSYGFKPFVGSYFQNFNFADVKNPSTSLNDIAKWRGYGYSINARGRNVIGVLEGTSKKNEFVLLIAHYDHWGMQQGKLYPGADDNASGTSGVLEAAEALGILARQGIRPERSVIVAFFDAEDWGEWGSAYFAENPPVALDQMVAVINLDMIGRNAHNDVLIIGSPELDDMPSRNPDMWRMAQKANSVLSLNLILPGQELREEQIFWRSDHASIFRASSVNNRIPVLFLNTGEHADYHKPTDTADKIDGQKAKNITRLALLIVWQTAESPDKPDYIE